jgi:hypothetical protein
MTQVSHSDLIGLLRSPLGEEKAQRSVQQALEQRGCADQTVLDKNVALGVLTDLASRSDLVGVAASLAQTRLELQLARLASVTERGGDSCSM